jgi:hypothetical protein
MFACLAIGLAATISGARDVEERIADRQDRRDDIADDVDDDIESRRDRRAKSSTDPHRHRSMSSEASEQSIHAS